ncbi:MAG: hypothetical protein CMD43_04025 [Gammaproteobacteria bacterium]|nr:hypothetical protein [Gammaproteobacteria bacterium]|tara:strand:- start:1790 stop:2245 length:456 start_codon:yes stop_codon:yes gene_type:complete
MKKLIAGILSILIIASCSTPKAMDIVQANDSKMTCNELMLAIEKATVNEDIAHSNKGVTDENILSGLFFFPAYFVTYGTSIHAQYNASERKEHLLKLYNSKNCAKPKDVEYQKIVAKTLAKLEQLKTQYIKGIISEDDYLIARRQLLLEFD